MKKGVQYGLPIVLLLLLIAGLGVRQLHDPVTLDEMYSFRHTGFFDKRNNPIETVQSVAMYSKQHAPLYFVTLSTWVNLTGVSKITMRILSLFGGLLSVALAYNFARSIVSQRYAFFVAFVIPLFAFFFYYFTDIRMYSILPGLIFLLYWKYWQIMLSNKPIYLRDWIFLYVIVTVMIYTHYLAIVPFLSLAIYHMIEKKDKRWFKVVGVMILAGLTFMLWLPVVIEGFQTRTSLEETNQTLSQLIYSLADLYTNHMIAFVVVYIIGGVFLLRSHLKHKLFLLTIIIVPIAIMSLVNNITPLLPLRRMRYSLFMLPSFTLIFAFGLYTIYQWRRFALLFVAVIWFIAFLTFFYSERMGIYTARIVKDSERWPAVHTVAEYVSRTQYMPSPEQLFTISPDIASLTSVAGNYASHIRNPYIHILETYIYTELNRAALITLPVLVDFEHEPAFWLGYRPDFDLKNNATYQNVLTKYHRSCGIHKSDETMIIEYYLQRGIPCELIETATDTVAHFEHHQIKLLHFYSEIDGEYLNTYSVWKRDQTDHNFPNSISFQVFNTNNEKVLQQDFISPFEPIDVKTFDISELPAGNYRLEIILYDFETLETNYVIDDSSSEKQRSVVVAEFGID